MTSRFKGNSGLPYTGPGGHFTPGCWRPDAPSEKIAIKEGPDAPVERPDPPTLSDKDSRSRDPRTAANLAAKADALAPRRWRPS